MHRDYRVPSTRGGFSEKPLKADARYAIVAAIAMIADRLDGKLPQPRGGSDELGPQQLHITWGGQTCQAADQRAVATTPNAAGDLPVPSRERD